MVNWACSRTKPIDSIAALICSAALLSHDLEACIGGDAGGTAIPVADAELFEPPGPHADAGREEATFDCTGGKLPRWD